MKATDLIIIALLGIWFSGSLLVQMRVFSNLARKEYLPLPKWTRWDYFALFPRFSFFSWIPNFNFELLYRDKLCDMQIGPWTTVPMPPRTLFRFIWNPGKRKRFVVEDLSRSLLARAEHQLATSATPSAFSYAYVNLAYYIAGLPSSPLSVERQFLIARSFAEKHKSAEVVFVSPFFYLSKPEQGVCHVDPGC